MAKKKYQKFYKYKCTITEEEFTVTKEAPNPDELTSVTAFYEMHAEEDDRPEHIKIQSKQKLEEDQAQAEEEAQEQE